MCTDWIYYSGITYNPAKHNYAIGIMSPSFELAEMFDDFAYASLVDMDCVDMSALLELIGTAMGVDPCMKVVDLFNTSGYHLAMVTHLLTPAGGAPPTNYWFNYHSVTGYEGVLGTKIWDATCAQPYDLYGYYYDQTPKAWDAPDYFQKSAAASSNPYGTGFLGTFMGSEIQYPDSIWDPAKYIVRIRTTNVDKLSY